MLVGNVCFNAIFYLDDTAPPAPVRQVHVPGPQDFQVHQNEPPLDVKTATLVDLSKAKLIDIVLDQNVLNNTATFIKQAKTILLNRFFENGDHNLLDPRRHLNRLKVSDHRTGKNEQWATVKKCLFNSPSELFVQFLRQMECDIRQAKKDKRDKVARIIMTLNHNQIKNLLRLVEQKLGLRKEDRPQGTLRVILKKYLLNNRNDPNLSSIFLASRFTAAASDFHQFPRWQNEQEVKDNRSDMKGINEQFLMEGKLQVEDNPMVDAFTRFHNKIENNIKLPDHPCDNCEAQDLDITVKLVRGQFLCNLCTTSARARKFGQENRMAPGDQPDALKDLKPAEIAAVSLVLPVVQVFRQGQGLRMKGHSISFPQELGQDDVLSHLPRLPANLSLVYVKAPGPPGQVPKVLHVRRAKIRDAILWLKDCNPYYAHIQLDQAALETYPVNGPLDLPGYQLSPRAHVLPDGGPVDSEVDEPEAEEPTPPVFEQSMRFAETSVGELQPDLVIAQLQAMVSGATAEQPLDWANHGPPTSERQPGFWEKAFPTLFCNGQAGYSTQRPHFVSREDWVQHLFRHKSGRFAANTTFVFFVFAFLQKERAWSLGNMYARSAQFTTKAALQADLENAGPDQLRQLAKAVSRQAARMPGTNAYHKAFGDYCASHIQFQRHHSQDRENFNVFFTLSAADYHWPAFYRIFPEGQQHLAKTLVRTEADIPQGANREDYVTASEDFLWRKDFLTKRAHHFDLFYRKQLDLLFDEVLVPVMGVTDHLIRYEYQSRGAVHAHIMMVVPMGVNEEERIEAWRMREQRYPEHQEDTHRHILNHCGHHLRPLSDMPDDFSVNARQHHIRMHILTEFVLGCGASERHPSDNPNDWYVSDGGTLSTAPSSDCLRQDWPTRLADLKRSLVNLTNKVGTHTCSANYCCKPTRQTVVVNGVQQEEEIARACRFGYPRDFIGFQPEFDDSGDIQVSVKATEAPVAHGVITRTEQDRWPVLRVRRNHPRTTSFSPYMMLGLPCNQDLQYVPTNVHLRNYVAKYISKTEPNSRSAEAFAREVLESMDPGDEVRKLCQKLIKQCTADHDYSLPEVHLYANKAEAFKFSREMVVVNVLNDRTFDFRADEGQPIIRQSVGERYDQRHDNNNFKALVQAYEQAEEDQTLHNNLLSKHPDQYSLYEYSSCFTRDWVPLTRFKVVHVLPAFKERPNRQTSPEWYKKFLLCMIRSHYVPRVEPLATLEALSDDELFDYGDEFFKSEEAPAWTVELWTGMNSLATVEDVIPLFAADNLPEDDQDHQVIGDDLMVADNGDDSDTEEDPDNGQGIMGDHATADYDKLADKLAMAPGWDHAKAGQFRATVRVGDNEAANPAALPHQALNEKQSLLVKVLAAHTKKVLEDGTQFFVEVCGSAGTGKTAALLRYLEDTAELLEDHESLSVGRFLLFAAATGAAAKLLPKPAKTLHSALNLPLNLKNNQAMEKLSPNTLGNLQEDLRDLRVLLIDEKSFVGCRFLLNISLRLMQIKDNYAKPFGGVSVVLIGDFKQLSPVNDLPLWTDRVSMSTFQRLGLTLYHETFKDVIVLTENMRQANDPIFKEIIQKVLADPQAPADQKFGVAEWDKLASRCMQNLPAEEQAAFSRDAVYLCSMKKDFMPHNINHIRALNNPRLLLSAINEPASGQRFGSNSAGGLPQHALLTRGMRVMLTANIDLSNGLSNGSIGTVIGIIFINATDEMPEVLVQFDTYAGQSCLPEVPRVYPISPITRTWTEGRVTFKRTMVPLVAAYGFSIHKSQGQTLGKVILNLGNREFAAGLTYTALTRAKCLKDMAFLPMPSFSRLENVLRSKTFRTQLADDTKKKGMEEEMLERNPEFTA